MTLFAEYVKEADGTRLKLRVLNAELWQTLLDKTTHLTDLRDATEVALHVSHKTGYTCLTESLCHHLQGYRLTSTRSTGNESVAVSHLTSNRKRSVGAMGNVKPAVFVVHSLF